MAREGSVDYCDTFRYSAILRMDVDVVTVCLLVSIGSDVRLHLCK